MESNGTVPRETGTHPRMTNFSGVVLLNLFRDELDAEQGLEPESVTSQVVQALDILTCVLLSSPFLPCWA